MFLVKRLHIYLFFCTKMRILLYNFCQKHAEFLGKISACFLIYITFFLYLLQ